MFARLGALVGGFTLEIVERLCADGSCGEPLDALSGLIDHSLVVADQRAGADPRFRMLETVRTFAAEQLTARGEAWTVNDWLAEHFARWAADVGPRLRGPGQRAWVVRVEDEMANMRAVAGECMDRSDVASVVRMFRQSSCPRSSSGRSSPAWPGP